MKVFNVAGARSNFLKVAPIQRALELNYPEIDSRIIYTGQNEDSTISEVFLKYLKLPKPHVNLNIGGGTSAAQTARVMLAFESLVQQEQPDMIVTVGDVNATLAAALVAKKNGVPLAHVEAGLRSFDNSMPEEINRVLVDRISDLLFISEPSGLLNLTKEGVENHKKFFVGNVMVDALKGFIEQARALTLEEILSGQSVYPARPAIPLKEKGYFMLNIHRPANVDHAAPLKRLIKIIRYLSTRLPVVFPLYPRTKNRLSSFGLLQELSAVDNLLLLPPQGYLHFLSLMDKAKAVITDSGSVQEETTFLNVPCLTLSDATERPITTKIGSNLLIPEISLEYIQPYIETILECGCLKYTATPPLWDGQAAQRIAKIIAEY
ncbi:UDP-N-acetylglucosamine 2-epimerase (non-hydrolyzing) [Phaeodactylibacter sp.]|uniref:non-hydrolyzing UDP-N-acetylglucosamine 2-epimerase n=1 Tax=Phaeodactylibacter sp. TaxID=1940289 RepID=UPI0025D8E660|nr:UDP-N-acetylglucosamine 2-epimerase (non-hydrolyzing) [Phaeodactylibacter sp.]MCI4648420.1 UDP-N-acetylglucosamine 2-epimerase (non-hydrolyzing) [Phaeodactylibacter sp.]MCI5093150.1 UDP-N-acetylglucosamine 2-epimerase (non-hydrolyzing) [Phaeodactylibacter sp.]